MNLALQTIKALFRKTEAKIPKRLSDLEDDLKIPGPDWNQNDPEAKDYIKNRPFYEKQGLVRLQTATTIMLDENGRCYYDGSWYPQEGEIYTVIWDGVEYISEPAYQDSDANGNVCVTIAGETVWFFEGSYIYGSPTMTGEHTFEICKPGIEVLEIPERYIPESIARADWVEDNKMNSTNPEGSGSLSINRQSNTPHGANSQVLGWGLIAPFSNQNVTGVFNKEHDKYYFEDIQKISEPSTPIYGNIFYFSQEYTFDGDTGNFTLVNPISAPADKDTINATGFLAPGLWYVMGRTPVGSSMYSFHRTLGVIVCASVSNNYVYILATRRHEGKITASQVGKYLHMVGNGTSRTKRSNAHTLDWNGVGWYQGGLQVGGNAQDDGARNVLLEGDAIPVPEIAAVGQTVMVKTVDENGKPTEWEAVDKPVYVADVSFRMGRYSLADGEYDKLLDAYTKRSIVALNSSGILFYLVHVDDEHKMHFAQIPYGGETALAISNWYLVVSPDNAVSVIGRSFMTTDYMEEIIVPRIPTKLSDLTNDLFYANATEAFTLTKEDFVPKYSLDDEGNPTDQIERYYYNGTPALDWFTSPDKIGFIIQFTDGDELITINHHVPGVTAQWDDSQWTDDGYLDEENSSMPFIVCDECSLAIANGMTYSPDGELAPEDGFIIDVLDWWDWDNENGTPVGVGFDSITIYKIDAKKISEHLYDHEDIDEQISELGYDLDEVWDYADDISNRAHQAQTAANQAQTAADSAQTTASQAKTAANSAQTTASQALSAASKKLTLARIDFAMPNGMWTSITYGNGKFVAVCNSKTATYSEDGITWTATTMPVANGVRSATYGNGKFVALPVSNSKTAAYSEDGITWTATTMPTSANWYAATYANGKFVAVASSASKAAAYSEDGITWTATTMPVSDNWHAVVYGNGKFVAVGDSGAAYSEDGITWTATTMPVSDNWYAATYGNGKFVAAASNSNIAAYSEDGITWTATTMPDTANWRIIAYGNGKFVAVSYNTGTTAAYSEDGITWTATTMPTSAYWKSATYGNGKFVAVCNSNIAAHSEDGITWIDHVEAITMNGVDVTNQIRKLLGGF